MASTPKGWWQEAAGLCPAMPGRAPQGVPSILDPSDGRFEAHTMHGCAHTKQVKSGAKAMINKAKTRNTACNTRAASKERWLPACGSAPHGPCRPHTGRSAARRGVGLASLGPCRPQRGRAAATELLQLTD